MIHRAIDRVVDLTDPAANRVFRLTVEKVRCGVATAPEAVRARGVLRSRGCLDSTFGAIGPLDMDMAGARSEIERTLERTGFYAASGRNAPPEVRS